METKQGPYESSCSAALALQPESDVERARLTAIVYARFADSEAKKQRVIGLDDAIKTIRNCPDNCMTDKQVMELIEALRDQLGSVEHGEAFRALGQIDGDICRQTSDLLDDSAHFVVDNEPYPDHAEISAMPPALVSQGLATDYVADLMRSPA